MDNSVVANYARILQHAEITGGSVISNWATVKGSAVTWHDNTVATGAQAWNDAVLDGDFSTAQSVSNGFQFGFEEYNAGPLNWITNRTAPRRLYAAYEFNAPHDSLAKDLLGVTDGYLQGNPGWVNSDGQRSGFLAFNGANQFVILDRSLSDLKEITVTAWVKWSGGAANQPVWYFGTATTNCMFFTPDDGTGSAKFSITTGGVTQTLAWTSPLPVGVWTHVAVSLSNSVTGRLYINGANVATGSITLTPDQLNAPNVNTASAAELSGARRGNFAAVFPRRARQCAGLHRPADGCGDWFDATTAGACGRRDALRGFAGDECGFQLARHFHHLDQSRCRRRQFHQDRHTELFDERRRHRHPGRVVQRHLGALQFDQYQSSPTSPARATAPSRYGLTIPR